MSRARTWRWRRMRRYGELSSGVERSSPRQFFPDYTIAMRGYDFREGQVAEPMAKSPREMGVVAKAAGVRDLAETLACLQRRAAMQKARSVIQTKRANEFASGHATRREQLLQLTQRDSRFGCDFARTEIR